MWTHLPPDKDYNKEKRICTAKKKDQQSEDTIYGIEENILKPYI
jgi:hypothetical protein